MKTIEISKNRFKELKPYVLPNEVFNTEASMYVLPGKQAWLKELKLLKKFYLTNGPVFGNKLSTLNSLVDLQDTIGMEELVFPEKLASVSHQLVGFTMPLIDATNLKVILNDKSVPIPQKIAYLKEVGSILRKMQDVRKNNATKDFYLNDMHEGNFVLNKETGKINVVDLDSASIGSNMPFCSKYLSPSSPISTLEQKYKRSTMPCTGIFIPDENSDLYCYNMMILNFIFGDDYVHRLPQEVYYSYMDYLRKIGMPRELVDIFAKVYYYSNNENPDYLLDSLEPYVYRAYKHVFAQNSGYTFR